MRASRRERGSAMLVAMGVGMVLLMVVLALLTYAHGEHMRASRTARVANRLSCAQAGLQIARTYFASNVSSWNTYLSDPHEYDPVDATWIHGAPYSTTPADPTLSALQTAKPALFYDLDGDTKPDVYIYIRDNQDEMLPHANDWGRDNDLNVFVGAVCISSTMVPRHDDGSVDTSQLSVESLLSYNSPANENCAQASCGNGGGNVN